MAIIKPSESDGSRDRLDLTVKPEQWRWRLGLVWFMRLMSLVWLSEGVLWWSDILGITGGTPFEAKRAAAKAVAVGFGVVDLVAAVGLWLASAWGGVMWLLALTSECVLSFFAPGLMNSQMTRIGILVFLIVLYLLLTSLAAREEDSL